jgi:hypothetical protein
MKKIKAVCQIWAYEQYDQAGPEAAAGYDGRPAGVAEKEI